MHLYILWNGKIIFQSFICTEEIWLESFWLYKLCKVTLQIHSFIKMHIEFIKCFQFIFCSFSLIMILIRTFITTPLYTYFLKMNDCMASITGSIVTIGSSIVIVGEKIYYTQGFFYPSQSKLTWVNPSRSKSNYNNLSKYTYKLYFLPYL